MTCHFNLRHMISVHVSALFKQTSHYGGNQYRTYFKRLFITKAISTCQSLLYRKTWHQLTYQMISVPYTFQKTFHYESNQYLSVITVPKNLTSTYISNDFSTVHISKDFSLRNQSGKIVSGQWGTDSTVYRKYPSLAKNQDGECSLMQQLTHPAHPKRLISPSYLFFGGKAEKYKIRAE